MTVRRGPQILVVGSAAVLAWIATHLSSTWLKVPVPFESRFVVAVSLPATVIALTLIRLMVVRPLARRVYPRLSRGPILMFGPDQPRDSLDEVRARRPVVRHSIGSLSPGRAQSLAAEYEAGEVVVVTGSIPSARAVEIAFACLDQGADVRLLPRAVTESLPGDRVGQLPMMRFRSLELSGPERFFRRVIDIAGSSIGLVLLSPLFLGIALLVKLNSPGPAIYRQERVGRNGRRFNMYKFRTMHHGSDPREHENYLRSFIRHGQPAEVARDGTPVYKPRRDARVTTVGAWLRRLSLDELPQLYNTLIGNMTLVGPRPCLPFEWELYEPWQRRRLDVTPGCTGLWQVKARSRVRFEDMVIMDIYYAHNGTLLSDLSLIAQTIPTMILGRGAY